MFAPKLLSIFLLSALLSCASASAQEGPAAERPAAAPTVTAAATRAGVRFTALGHVARMRLEVFDASGQVVFDTGFQPGSVRDWRLTGARGQRLPDGAYLCILTVRELAGRLSFKQGNVWVERGRASLALDGGGQPAPVEAEKSFTAGDAGGTPAMSVTAHDGEDGQVTSTKGALTFRTGDLFSGKDKERMRITEDGNIGIGTKDPQAALDVAGTIRAGKGVVFADGTVQTTGTSGRVDAEGNIEPAVAGSGTTGRLVKWTNGPAETLGDSIVTESGSNIGLGTTTPRARLDIKQAADSFIGGLHLRRSATNDTWALVTGTDNSLYMGYANSASGADAAADFSIFPLVLTTNNKVGIGTTTPSAKLQVNGNVEFTGLRTEASATSPNVVGGYGGNTVTAGAVGAAIAGGGNSAVPHAVTDNYGTIGGGLGNFAGGGTQSTSDASFATVGGGENNFANGPHSTVAGGDTNVARSRHSTVGGGEGNLASFYYATIAGGSGNTASGQGSTIAGGQNNSATSFRSTVGGGYGNQSTNTDATVGGGIRNVASGVSSTVPGGSDNTAQGNWSFAAGSRAQALHQSSFVWSDTTTSPPNFFSSTGNNQFLVNAMVGIGTNAPNHRLTVGPPEPPVQPAARLGVYSAGSAYAIVRDTTNNAEGVFGATNIAVVYGSLTDHKVEFRANNLTHMVIRSNGNVGIGTINPAATLDVDGHVRLDVSAGNGAALCRNNSREIVDCSASSARHKLDIKGLSLGLGVVRRLRPVGFTWKSDGQRDMGLVAEEVGSVEPQLVTRNAAGGVEGVRYDRLGVVLINAVKEQQAEIERQRAEIEALKQLVCAGHPDAGVCKSRR